MPAERRSIPRNNDMGRSFGGKARGNRYKASLDNASRVYESLGTAGNKFGNRQDEEEPRPAGERDAVRNFLHQKKLPTSSRRRAFFSDASGLPLDADAPEMRSKATPVVETFNRLLKVCCDIDQDQYLRQEKMRRAWPELLGEELAGKLEFEKTDGNVIYAYARNHVELFEIRQFKLRALEAKAKKNPVFRGIRQICLKCRR